MAKASKISALRWWGGKLHSMFTSSVNVPSGKYFNELGKDEKFMWHQSHAKGWVARGFELHIPVAMHNATGQAVPLTWLLLDSQLMMDLIANPNVLMNIRKVRSEDAICVHCNSGVKVVDWVGDLPGYGTL